MDNPYKDISISWYGDVTSIAGSAQQARIILKTLVQGGGHVQLMPLKSNRAEAPLDEWWKTKIQPLTQNEPGLVMINHTQPGIWKANPTGGPVIMCTQWETFAAPIMWRKALNNDQFDEIWSPSKSLLKASIAAKTLSKPTYHLPCPLNVNEFLSSKAVTQIGSLSKEHFVFGTSGIWNNRRNLSDLIITFCAEFNAIDKVTLVIKTNGLNHEDPNERQRIIKLVREVKKSLYKDNMPEILILQDIFEYDTMDAILRRFDAYVSTSRAETKCITMMKIMTLGKPCIFLPVHGGRDLNECKSDLMYPIGFVSEPVTQMGQYYSGMDYWARPDLGDMARKMRQAYNDTFTKSLEGPKEIMLNHIKSNYDSKVIVDNMTKHLREISPIKVEELVLPTEVS